MIKTIKFNDNEVQINTSTGWLYDYREQFGEDFLTTIYPMLVSLVESIGDIQKTNGKVDIDTTFNLVVNSLGVKSTMIQDTLWAMAHNADSSIPGPKEWSNQFDGFPIDEIGVPLIETILTAFMSKKKVKNLMTSMTETTGLISMSLQSGELTEDLTTQPSGE